jgi:hypothetical protein
VTRFYLAGFANQADQVRRTALEKPNEPHLVSISDATVQKDFYLVQEEDGAFDDRIERYLGRIEARSAMGFKALLADREWPVTPLTRERIATWIALQYLRGPAERQMLNENADMMFKLQMALDGREGVRNALNLGAEVDATEEEVDAAFAEYSDTDAYHVELSPNDHIRFILDELRGVTRTMYARKWSIVEFQRKTLATCDHPVVLVPAEDQPPFTGVGLFTAGGVYLPLNRRLGLLMGDIPPEVWLGKFGTKDARLAGTTAFADLFNGLVVANAREAVFTHPVDAHLTSGPLPSPRRVELTHPHYATWREVGEKLRASRVNSQ